MRAILIAVAVLGGCAAPPAAPTTSSCVEFDHATTRAEKPVTCRMLWCEQWVLNASGGGITGGVATLWCEP